MKETRGGEVADVEQGTRESVVEKGNNGLRDAWARESGNENGVGGKTEMQALPAGWGFCNGVFRFGCSFTALGIIIWWFYPALGFARQRSTQAGPAYDDRCISTSLLAFQKEVQNICTHTRSSKCMTKTSIGSSRL